MTWLLALFATSPGRPPIAADAIWTDQTEFCSLENDNRQRRIQIPAGVTASRQSAAVFAQERVHGVPPTPPRIFDEESTMNF